MHSITFTSGQVSRQIKGKGMKIKLAAWLQNQKEEARQILNYCIHSTDPDAELYRGIVAAVGVWFALNIVVHL